MWKKVVVTIAVVLMVISVAYWAFCQGNDKCAGFEGKWHGPGHRMAMAHLGRFLTLRAELNLTDEQHEEMKKIILDRKEDIEPVAKEIVEARRALKEAVLEEKPDEKKIRAAADDLAKAIGDAAVLASEIAGEAREVLTKEQIELLKSFSEGKEKSIDKHLEKLFD